MLLCDKLKRPQTWQNYEAHLHARRASKRAEAAGPLLLQARPEIQRSPSCAFLVGGGLGFLLGAAALIAWALSDA